MIIQPILEFTILFPASFLCFLATAEHLQIKVRTLTLAAVPVLTLVCVLGGAICWHMQWPTNYLLLPMLVPAAAAFCRLVDLPAWKSVSVFLAVCAALSCLSLSVILDAVLSPANTTPWLSPVGGLIDFAQGWALVALVWYPATHAARSLLRTEDVVRSYYVFWILPAAFILINLHLLSLRDSLLLNEQLMGLYALLCLVLTGLLLLFYLLFYLVARELGQNAQLRQENQFLHMQTAQYEVLRAAIDETRQARHDMRHQFSTMSALADKESWEELRRYLAEASASVPNAELGLCENQAVDGVAGRYAALSRQNGVPFQCRLDLPAVLPVREMDLCVVLQNLLENALEASRNVRGQRYIHLRASLHGDRLVLLTVENLYSGELVQRNNVLQSTKPGGAGIGLQSVAHIAEKNGGYCRFVYGDGVFTANVMLRGEAPGQHMP